MICSNDYFYIGEHKDKSICCFSREHKLEGTNLQNLDSVPWDLLKDKKVVKTDGNFIIFIDQKYIGNYIYATDYQIIAELDAIVILK